MTIQVRSGKPETATVRRPVTAKECRSRIAMAIFIGIVEIFEVFVFQSVALKFVFGSMALLQLSQIWIWRGMLERIKRGETVEVAAGTAAVVNVPNVVGYIAATLLSALTLLWNLTSLFLLFLMLAHPTPGKLALLGFLFTIAIGISFLSVYVWKRVLADAKATPTLQAPSSVATVPTHTSTSLRPGHWWTDTAIREETRIDRNRRRNGDNA